MRGVVGSERARVLQSDRRHLVVARCFKKLGAEPGKAAL